MTTGAAPSPLLEDSFLRRLEGLRLRARRLTGAPAGARPGRQRTPATDFVDHRPYSPGDDLRHVDWAATARHDSVVVKVGQRPQATAVELFLDVSPSMSRPEDKDRLGRQLVAALGWLSLAAGDRVTLRVFPGPSPHSPVWGPAAGPGAAVDFLGAVGRVAPARASVTSVVPALDAAARGAPAGGLAVIVSDLWLVDDIDTALARLPSPRWDVMVLHILAREEMSPRIGGAVELVDAESGASLPMLVDSHARAAYRAVLKERLERLRAVAARRGSTYAYVPAEWPLERAVLPYLRRRALLV